MKILSYFFALFLAVSGVTTLTTSHAHAACVNPVDFGAVANDGLSDRVAFQAALNSVAAGGDICVPSGRYDFERAPVSSYNRFAALATHGHDIMFRCDPGAELYLTGDQGAKATILFALDPSSRNITLDGCRWASDATNTDEQTHLIATTGNCGVSIGTCNPIDNISIQNNIFDHPRATPTTRRGDSVRLLGNGLTTLVRGVNVYNNVFLNAGRSAVELQRGLTDVSIVNNVIYCFDCDQAIDGEATGVSPGLEVYNTKIYGNVVTLGPGAQGDYDIALTSGIGAEIGGNEITRGIALVRSKNVKIVDQEILADMHQAGGVIEVTNVCEALEISGVRIVRSGIAGPVVRVVPTENGHCTSFKATKSEFVQRTASFGIFSRSTNAEIVDNLFVFQVPGSAAIYGGANVAPITSFVAIQNVVVGQLEAVLSLQSEPLSVSGVVHSNKSVSSPANVMCVGPGC